MVLSLSNWVSTQVTLAELAAFQKRLESLVRPGILDVSENATNSRIGCTLNRH
jgi:hypothetical protein